MERVRWEDYKGKRILFIDYSNLHANIPSEKQLILECITQARAATEKEKGKTLFLSYVHASSLDKDVMNSLKEFAAFTNGKGLVEKECVVGISPLQSMFVSTINLFSKAKLTVFDTLEKAKDWLVT